MHTKAHRRARDGHSLRFDTRLCGWKKQEEPDGRCSEEIVRGVATALMFINQAVVAQLLQKIVGPGLLLFVVLVIGLLCAMLLVILVLRRQILGFELGGPVFIKWVTFVIFVGLWFTYLGMSIANASA